MLLRSIRRIITKKMYQTVVDTSQNRFHSLLYSRISRYELRIKVRIVYGTTDANVPGSFGQEQMQTHFIRMVHVGTKRVAGILD